MNLASVETFLTTTNFSTSELKVLEEAMKIAVRRTQMIAGKKFRVGDKVKFSSWCGVINGTVVKINTKTIRVAAENGVRWSVSPTLLLKA